MKIAKYSSLVKGLVINLSVPESVEEFDQNAKRVGACLDEAINNCVYRGSLADFRSAFCEKLEEKYSIERLTKDTGRKDSNGNPITAFDETEGTYVDRVVATNGLTAEMLQPLADEVSAAIVFDASARERKAPTPKKLAAKWVDAAKTLLADEKKVVKFNERCHKLIGQTFTSTGDVEKDAQALGVLVRDWVAANEAAQIAKLVS